MLTEIFEVVLRMSLYGLVAGVFAMALSRVLRHVRASRSVVLLMWAVAAFRLICPYALPTSLRFFDKSVGEGISESIEKSLELGNTYGNSVKQIRRDMDGYEEIARKIGISGADSLFYEERADGSVQPAMTIRERWLPRLAVIWLLGVILFWGYGVFSWLAFKRKLVFAMKVEPGVYEVDTIRSSCVFGLVQPRIYLTPNLEDGQREYILCHEREHIRWHDQIWELLAFGILGLHWFNPPLWVMYRSFRNELECYCDERVLARIGEAKKEDYGEVLLKMMVKDSGFSLKPVAFGESTGKKAMKDRIGQILRYQKPKKSVQAALMLLTLAVGAGLLGSGPVKGAGALVASDEEQESEKQNREENSGKSGEAEVMENTGELAKRLYEKRNPYVGDASADGALLNELKEYLPDTEITMELETEQEPFVLRLVMKEGPADKPGTESQKYENVGRAAAVCLALIDNLGEVQWRYPLPFAAVSSGEFGEDLSAGPVEICVNLEGEVTSMGPAGEDEDESYISGSCTGEDLKENYGVEEIKSYGASAEKIQELLEILELETEETYSESVSYIGGSDGPTAVFLAGRYDYTTMDTAVSAELRKHLRSSQEEQLDVIVYDLYGEEEREGQLIRVPLRYLIRDCSLENDGALKGEQETFGSAVLVFSLEQDGNYELQSYEELQENEESICSYLKEDEIADFESYMDQKKEVLQEKADLHMKDLSELFQELLESNPLFSGF